MRCLRIFQINRVLDSVLLLIHVARGFERARLFEQVAEQPLDEKYERQRRELFIAIMIGADTGDWLLAFRARHGRPLRILHIGNIANNAYRNGRLQRELGIDADVVCPDYYHIMGCPEWEEADIGGAYDPFTPDWWTLNIEKFQRPAWFVQGPLLQCVDFLAARNGGQAVAARSARIALIKAYAAVVDGNKNPPASPRDVMAMPYLTVTRRLAPELTASGSAWLTPLRDFMDKYSAREWRRSLSAQTLSGLVDEALRAEATGTELRRRDRIVLGLLRRGQILAGRRGAYRPALAGYWSPDPARLGMLRLVVRYLLGAALWLTLQPFAMLRSLGRRHGETPAPAVHMHDDAQIDALVAEYVAANSNIPTAEARTEAENARENAGRWRAILAHYDIVQGYSTDAAVPMFAGHPNVTAYEHGTIRQIPFEPTPQGRLCRFTYAHVQRAFITNSDVLPSVEKIPIAAERRVLMPHAFDDRHLRDMRVTSARRHRLDDGIVLFSPTRHHWLTADPSLNKGNDVFLRGVAEVFATHKNIKLVLVDWGQHVEASRRLIRQLGIGDAVEWRPIMNRGQLWSAMVAAHAVADQFTLPALGGVGYECLTLGQRLITNLDRGALADFFGASPPALIAADAGQVAERVREIIADPEDGQGIGKAAAAWADRYHSTRRMLELQLSAYREMLSGASTC